MQSLNAELEPTSQQNISRTELEKEPRAYEITDNFKGNTGYFIKTFFADSTFNLNRWGVTKEALARDMKTALEKRFPGGKTAPFIVMDNFGHPNPDPSAGEEMVTMQERWRVGDTIDAGYDDASGRAWVIAQIFDPIAIKMFQDNLINFISPSLRALEEMQLSNGNVVITKFKVNHTAGVKKPAFGNLKAQIRGRCTGDPKTCLAHLANVQASVSELTCSKNGMSCVEIPVEIVEENSHQAKSNDNKDDSESLKTNRSNEESIMSNEDDKQKLERLEKEAKQASEDLSKKEEELKELKAQKKASDDEVTKLSKKTDELQANFEASEKRPLVGRIVDASIKLELITEADKQAKTDELMKESVSSLTRIDASYQAMVGKFANLKASTTAPSIRYTNQYQASEEDKKHSYDFVNTIRSKMGS